MRFTIVATILMISVIASPIKAAQHKSGTKAPIATKPATTWESSSSTDSMSDVASFSASKRGNTGLLSIRCKKGEKDSLTVLVGSDEFLGGNRVGMRELKYRLDNQPAVESRWAYSGRAAMLTNTDQSTALLIPMMKARQLLVRMYSYHGTSQDLSFDVTGVAPIVKQLLTNCQIGQNSAE